MVIVVKLTPMLKYPKSLYVKKKTVINSNELNKVVIKGIFGKFIAKKDGEKGNVDANIKTPTK